MRNGTDYEDKKQTIIIGWDAETYLDSINLQARTPAHCIVATQINIFKEVHLRIKK